MQAATALVLLGLLCGAFAHSYLDCADWRFNNPNVKRFNDSYGWCAGYARRYAATRMPYGLSSDYQYYRQYEQDKSRQNADAFPPCSQFTAKGNDGVTSVGSDERRGNPVSSAYAPNKDPDGFALGPMTVVTPGQELCWRWPAKNHAAHVDDNNMVFVNWATNPDTSDPTQIELNQMNVAKMRFRNCPDPGVPRPDIDQTGVGSNLMPCGGCFTVPNKAPGTYLVQWRWMLNAGEWYASCSDIQVVAPTSNNPTVPQTSTPQQPPTYAPQPTTPNNYVCTDTSPCANACGEKGFITCLCIGNQVQVECEHGDSDSSASFASLSVLISSIVGYLFF